MVTESDAPKTETTVDDTVEEPVVELASTSPEQKPSEEEPSKEPETLTKEQAVQLANDRLAKAQQSWDKQMAEVQKQLKEYGRVSKASEGKLKNLETELSQERKRADDAERRALGETPEPDALSQYEARLTLRRDREKLEEDRARLEDEKVAHEEEIADARREKTLRLAGEIASQYGVESSLLVTLTDGSREKMEALAKALPRKEADDNKPNLQKPPKPDSGRKSGTPGGPKTLKQMEEMSMSDYEAWVKERDKDKFR